MDDDAEVLAIVEQMLEEHRILTALNADEAVRIATSHVGAIHLLLTDVVMPGASGRELAQQLSLQLPEMKVLYMTALTLVKGQQQFSEAASGGEPEAPIILKPFTSERLTEKVRDVLAIKPASPFVRPPDPGEMSRVSVPFDRSDGTGPESAHKLEGDRQKTLESPDKYQLRHCPDRAGPKCVDA